MIHVNLSILNIPPYISTSWDQILSLSVEKGNLIISLTNGKTISIPDLTETEIKKIFETHALFLEKKEKNSSSFFPQDLPGLKFFLRPDQASLESFGANFQHNPAEADNPEIPQEILTKIVDVAKILGIESLSQIPKPQPHCNCTHCQIARAFHGALGNLESENLEEEDVSLEDLKFRTWDIEDLGDGLYNVTNPLDQKEQYRVYLKDPVGCTCGEKNCEHIRAVLNS